jgi:uncharacterized membrane protein (DUF485 family)
MKGDVVEHTATPYSADALDMPASKRCPANPVLCDPRFRALVRKRRSFAWSLTGLMLAAYFAFILTLAFRPALLGQPIREGAPVTWGFPIGFGLFAFTFALVAVYVSRANKVFDPITHDLKQGACK